AFMACLLVVCAHAAPARGANRASGTQSNEVAGAASAATRFLNRVAVSGRLQPSAHGRLPELREAPHDLELTSGAVLRWSDAKSSAQPARAIPNAAGRAGYVVQFAGESPDSARALFERAGGTAMSALPGGGWLVRMDAVTKSRVEGTVGHPLVRPWDPSFKLSPRLERSGARIEVAALLFDDGDLDATASGLTGLGATGMRRHRNDVNRLIRFTI